MLDQKAFDLIVEKTGAALTPQGFQRDKDGENETTALFVGESVAYRGAFFDEEKKQFELRACAMTDDGPDEKWKILSRSGCLSRKSGRSPKRRALPTTLSRPSRAPAAWLPCRRQSARQRAAKAMRTRCSCYNRLVGIFPDLREEIAEERSWYGMVRGVTFAKEHVLPKIESLLSSGRPEQIKRLCDILGDMYAAGDMDVRSIITIVLLKRDVTIRKRWSRRWCRSSARSCKRHTARVKSTAGKR